MTALINRNYIDGSKADTANGVNVANFLLGTGNAYDCLQTLGVGVSGITSGTSTLTQANAGLCLVDATAGNVIINLPAASAAVGALFQFKRVDSTANTVTINRAGSDTIDGATSITLSGQFEFQEIRSDGISAWRPLNTLANPARARAAIGSQLEPGFVMHIAGTAAPSGWIKANGALLSRTTYAALWTYAQASGNIAASDGAWTSGQFSPGDGSTTFRIPDLRGYHVRSFDDARGIDSGRTIGSVQADALLTHNHTATDAGHSHGIADPGHQHTVLLAVTAGVNANTLATNRGDGNNNNGLVTTNGGGYVGTGVTVNTGAASVTVANYSGATETRVKNLAMLACIKY